MSATFCFGRVWIHSGALRIGFAQREEHLQSQPEISAFVMDGDHGVFPLLMAQPSVEQ